MILLLRQRLLQLSVLLHAVIVKLHLHKVNVIMLVPKQIKGKSADLVTGGSL